ncbi:MAG TPA: type IV secretion system DNA-binding domain-containing protein [Mucilaginibacter sp.]|nr:type IV secretion system DNA-binding domain-containing protein [Mucilaginibacter sp.]
MNNVTYIGVTNYQNTNLRFGIKEKDRGGHIYCIGKTGSGKSTLLLNMAISDVKNNNGFGIIDPHGDISEAILNYIPKERITDVIYFNGSDIDFPIAFNPLHDIPLNNHHLVASNIVGTFKKVWSESWGPRLEHILRNSILTLLQYPNASLLDIQPLLTNFAFRGQVLHHIADTGLRNFWFKEFNTMPPAFRAEAIAPVINKIGLFQTHPILRTVFGQQTSSFSVADIMNTKKIFIVNLSKGSLGEDCTQLLGCLLITQFQTAALGRTKQPIEKRTPFYLYIDEMHSFITLSFADILAESRKYGLSLFLAHQYIEQLSDPIRAAIFGNVGTLISFRIGASDAPILEQEFSPVFNREDLVSLPRYAMYIKLLIDGTTSAPFSANSLPLPATGISYAKDILLHSRNRYATKREVVERQLQQRHNVTLNYTEQSLFR